MEHQINWFNLLVGGVTDKVEEEVAEIVEINEEKKYHQKKRKMAQRKKYWENNIDNTSWVIGNDVLLNGKVYINSLWIFREYLPKWSPKYQDRALPECLIF